MQRYCTELTERLLKSLDKEYNVVDMGAVVDVITALEKTTITKEVLEITRLGKYINELRRKTNNDALAKRAKDLVRRWRDMVLPSANATPQPTPADTAPQALNGTKPQSPALRGLKPHSPAIRSLKPHSPALKAFKPHSPLIRDSTPLKQVPSPASSLHSEHSRSPNPTPTKQQQQKAPSTHAAPPTTAANATNHRPNSDLSPKLGLTSVHNHTIEAVPRTHSSNKRLRKEELIPIDSPPTPPISSKSQTSLIRESTDSLASRLEPIAKRQRLNGETSSSSLGKLTESSGTNNASISRVASGNGSRSITLNQQVPIPRESEKAIERSTDQKFNASIRDQPDALSVAPAGPKKRGRKKGSKSLKNQTLPEDRVKEKLASISRNPKLKTTQELLADLQARGSNTALFGAGTTTLASGARSTEPPSTEQILRSAGNDDRPLSSRFYRANREKMSSLRSSTGRDGGAANFADSAKSRTKLSGGDTGKRWEGARKTDDDEDDDDDEDHGDDKDDSRRKELTVEEILAKLPPLDREAISWSDCDETIDDDEATEREIRREVTEEDVERLHDECVEGLNGNFQVKMKITSEDNDMTVVVDDTGNVRVDDIKASDDWNVANVNKKGVYRRLGTNEDDREFREWHEMLARPSYEGQTLHILPYVIID